MASVVQKPRNQSGMQRIYPPALYDLIRDSYAAGHTSSQISDMVWVSFRVHMSRSAVQGMVHRNNWNKLRPAEFVQKKKEAQDRRKDAAAIIQHRLNKRFGKRKQRTKKESPLTVGQQIDAAAADREIAFEETVPVFLAIEDEKRTTGDTVALVDLKDNMCKWPIEIDGKSWFCGHVTPKDKPYCDYHAGTSKRGVSQPTKNPRKTRYTSIYCMR